MRVKAVIVRRRGRAALVAAALTTWWSTTSLSHAHTQRPYGPVAQRPLDVRRPSAARRPPRPASRSRRARGHPEVEAPAEYAQSGSIAQSRQRSAAPAGARSGRRWWRLAERGDRRAGAADQVREPVEVVAALGEQHRPGLVLAAPVAADVGVRLVPEADRLEVLDADDLADRAGVEQPLERAACTACSAARAPRRRRRPRARTAVRDPHALRLGRRERLLDQQRVALRRRARAPARRGRGRASRSPRRRRPGRRATASRQSAKRRSGGMPCASPSRSR